MFFFANAFFLPWYTDCQYTKQLKYNWYINRLTYFYKIGINRISDNSFFHIISPDIKNPCSQKFTKNDSKQNNYAFMI